MTQAGGTNRPYLELAGVEAWLGPRRVFADLSLELRLGEHTVVLGPNGSGKSTLIKLLSREVYPVVKPGSRLRIFGSSRVNLWELRSRIGHVSTDLLLHHRPTVPAEDVVISGFFGSVGLGRSQSVTEDQRQRAALLLEKLGLAGLQGLPFGQLSDGQRRRLLLARALVNEPELLVLDEPTNGLDLRARHQLLTILRQLARTGTTILLVTHQIEAIIPEISRCVLLEDGAVVGDGPKASLLQDGPLSRLYNTPVRVIEAAGWRQLLPL
ncbi:MAG: ATP-binding cassette domain-containing protein [Cyanobacteriota bacterium]|nr:ATP-binding cassette domain-containing protein [Cyanobacteriota bacterium]